MMYLNDAVFVEFVFQAFFSIFACFDISVIGCDLAFGGKINYDDACKNV